MSIAITKDLGYFIKHDSIIFQNDLGISLIQNSIITGMDKMISFISKASQNKDIIKIHSQKNTLEASHCYASDFWLENALDFTSTKYLFNRIIQGSKNTRKNSVHTQVSNLFKYPTIMLIYLSKLDHLRNGSSQKILEQEFTNDRIYNLEKYMRGFWTRQVSRPTMWKSDTIKNFSDVSLLNENHIKYNLQKIDNKKEYFRILDTKQIKKYGIKIFDKKLTSEFGSFCLSSGINKRKKSVNYNQDDAKVLLAKASAISIAQLYNGTRNNKILYHIKNDFTFMWIDPIEKPALYSIKYKDLIDSKTYSVDYKNILKMISGKSVEFKYIRNEIDIRVLEALKSMGKEGGYVIGKDIVNKDFDIKIRRLISNSLLKQINRLDEIFSYTLILKEKILSPKNDPGFCTFGNFARLHTRLEHIYENTTLNHSGHINIHQRFAHQWIDGSPALSLHTQLVNSFVKDSDYNIDHLLISKNAQNENDTSFCVKITEAEKISEWEQKLGEIRNFFVNKGLPKKNIRGISLDIIIMNALMRELDINDGHFLESYDLNPEQKDSEKGITPVIIPTPRFNIDNENQKKEIKKFSQVVINNFSYISEGRLHAKMGMGHVSAFSVLTQRYKNILQNIGMFVSRDVTKMLVKPKLMYSRLSSTNANKSAFYTAISDVYKEAVVIGSIYQNKRTHDDGDTLYLTFDLGPEIKDRLKHMVQNLVKSSYRIQELINDELDMLKQISENY